MNVFGMQKTSKLDYKTPVTRYLPCPAVSPPCHFLDGGARGQHSQLGRSPGGQEATGHYFSLPCRFLRPDQSQSQSQRRGHA